MSNSSDMSTPSATVQRSSNRYRPKTPKPSTSLVGLPVPPMMLNRRPVAQRRSSSAKAGVIAHSKRPKEVPSVRDFGAGLLTDTSLAISGPKIAVQPLDAVGAVYLRNRSPCPGGRKAAFLDPLT
jgi:hypothetical protein